MLYNQLRSDFWGVWGVEQYKYPSRLKTKKHGNKTRILTKMLASDLPFRIKLGLNFSYGICDLKGFSTPITFQELKELTLIYYEAVRFASQYPDMEILLQELFFIKKTADSIPGFTAGKVVNESNQRNIHRKYVGLDFLSFH